MKFHTNKINCFWTPAFAGVTAWGTYYESIKAYDRVCRSSTDMKMQGDILYATEWVVGYKTRPYSAKP
jgi:hypothetical protein